jgi:hypothetical protein
MVPSSEVSVGSAVMDVARRVARKVRTVGNCIFRVLGFEIKK